MAETGDWVTPRLYGKPWFEKPPLYYWGAAICFKLFGVSEAAARLPSAISALLATLALAWLAWRLYGAETARWLLLLLPTTVGMIGFSHAAATDMPFSAMLTIAMVCAAVLLRIHVECGGLPPLSRTETDAAKSSGTPVSPEGGAHGATPLFANTSWLAAILFGFFLGLAVLAKGPAAIILCGGAIFFWALFTKRWRDALRLFHPAALASFCATALPWYILCARRNPDFFRIFIIEHNFKRYLTPEFQHIQPFWFYGPIVVIGLCPWIVWLLGFSTASLRHWTSARSAVFVFFAAWAAFTLVFFTFSKSKLPGYILPAIPPLLFLLIGPVYRLISENRAVARWPLVAFGILCLGSSIWAFWDLFQFRDRTHMHWTFWVGPAFVLFFSVPAVIGGLVIIVAVIWKRLYLAQIIALITLLLMVSVVQDSLRKLAWVISARSVASEISEVDSAEIYAFQMRRAWIYQLDFYLHREILEWTPARSGPALVVIPRKHIAELKSSAKVLRVVSDFSGDANVVEVVSLSGSSAP
jgi:4-amino-4-deoxy-L-arabinose transferase-like glycosyltransferase